jgi:hypothetical protein
MLYFLIFACKFVYSEDVPFTHNLQLTLPELHLRRRNPNMPLTVQRASPGKIIQFLRLAG